MSWNTLSLGGSHAALSLWTPHPPSSALHEYVWLQMRYVKHTGSDECDGATVRPCARLLCDVENIFRKTRFAWVQSSHDFTHCHTCSLSAAASKMSHQRSCGCGFLFQPRGSWTKKLQKCNFICTMCIYRLKGTVGGNWDPDNIQTLHRKAFWNTCVFRMKCRTQ